RGPVGRGRYSPRFRFAAADVVKRSAPMWRPRRSTEWSKAMPQRRHRLGQSLTRLVFLAAALSLLSAVLRRERAELLKTSPARRRKIRLAPKRIAASLAFTTLFLSGAAFSAGAGNTVVKLIDPSSSSDESALSADGTTSTATTDEQAPAPEPTRTESAPADPAAPLDEPSPSEP